MYANLQAASFEPVAAFDSLPDLHALNLHLRCTGTGVANMFEKYHTAIYRRYFLSLLTAVGIVMSFLGRRCYLYA